MLGKQWLLATVLLWVVGGVQQQDLTVMMPVMCQTINIKYCVSYACMGTVDNFTISLNIFLILQPLELNHDEGEGAKKQPTRRSEGGQETT